ncbi:GntR family transcriptional regulator [Lacticaseibacillus kribbianus]|uniref:GntR family transcriptional regulator n=1 Tax=Lacticaseibacillus kribbianus TaxID=2926292 RepID=UPI001CD61F91|nr:GntR family transcriptional regulator [Lacticaseibacillus kribbianus]
MEKKYQAVTAAIRGWIADGQYGDDAQLPTESALMQQFAVSRHTIRKALAELEAAAWVYRVQGAGSFVTPKAKRGAGQPAQGTVAVIATYLNDYIFPAIIEGVEQTLSASGVALMLASTRNDPALEAQTLARFLANPVSGLIIEPSQSAFELANRDGYRKLLEAGVPMLTINARAADLPVPALVMDDAAGGRLATEYVLARHHRRLLGVFKTDDQQGIDRMNGFVTALQRMSGSTAASLVTYRTETAPATLEAQLTAVLARPDRPTAVVCYNDTVALRVATVAQGLGLTVPADLSLIGFDNAGLATATGEQLTSIDHPKAQMGQDAAAMMLSMLAAAPKAALPQSRVYAPVVVPGDTVRDLAE